MLLLGTVGAASAQSGNSERAGTRALLAWDYGIIETVDGVTLEVATPVGRLTVITDTNTVFQARGRRRKRTGRPGDQ